METYLKRIDDINKLLLEEKLQLATEKIQELKKVIIYDIALKSATGGQKERLRSAKELIKNCKLANESRPLFHKIYKVDDTYQICDGYTAVVLNEMIEGLELNTEKAEYLDCRKIINSCNPTGYNFEKVEIDMMELEQKSIQAKRVKDRDFTTEEKIIINNLHFNPIYVLRAIKILGKDNVNIYAHTTSQVEPLYLKSDFGEAIVLPIRQPKN